MEDSKETLKFPAPPLLTFLKVMMIGKDTGLKLASIGQAIMEATHPRVMRVSLQFAFVMQMSTAFASRFLVNSLNKHGFSCFSTKNWYIATNQRQGCTVHSGQRRS